MSDDIEIDIDEIHDESVLQAMLDEAEDPDERKMIRNRILEVKQAARAKRDEMLKRVENSREEGIQRRQREAAESKKKTLEMYDQMAKSAPAGGNKTMDVSIMRSSQTSASTPRPAQRDLVEEGIRDRIKHAEDQKKRMLAAFDAAARSGPAGSVKDVNFDNFKGADVSQYSQAKPSGCCTFGSTGGVPKVVKDDRLNARAKFQQMDTVVNKAAGGTTTTTTTVRQSSTWKSGAGVVRSATDVKEMLLTWAKTKTFGYKNVEITNFSSSWSDGMAFCALIHHYFPDAFDYDTLEPKNRRKNFQLAFTTAEEKADIAQLLDVDDMVIMKNKPDWKCVFTYIQGMYRKLREMD